MSLFSLVLVGLIYVFGTILLVWLGKILKNRWDGAWKLMVPLFPLLYIGPIAEELWIAWNFGRLCKKDAGLFIYRTAEVEGFYDATAVLHEIYKPLAPQSVEYYEKGGYRYYELGLSQPSGAPNKVVHIERVEGVWTPTVLDSPSARYHFEKDVGVRVAHKIYRQTSKVVDSNAEDILARYRRYSRKSPWFFLGLDNPGLGCDGSSGGPRNGYSFLIYRDVLKPAGGGP
jgi:hypothetical protein